MLKIKFTTTLSFGNFDNRIHLENIIQISYKITECFISEATKLIQIRNFLLRKYDFSAAFFFLMSFRNELKVNEIIKKNIYIFKVFSFEIAEF